MPEESRLGAALRAMDEGFTVWREREFEPGTYDLVDKATGEIVTGEIDDTVMFDD